jgi:hypothetical protein
MAEDRRLRPGLAGSSLGITRLAISLRLIGLVAAERDIELRRACADWGIIMAATRDVEGQLLSQSVRHQDRLDTHLENAFPTPDPLYQSRLPSQSKLCVGTQRKRSGSPGELLQDRSQNPRLLVVDEGALPRRQ